MSKTSIEWTDHSINPLRATNKGTGQNGHFCVKISPGCKFCYSSKLQSRFGTFPFVVENRPKLSLFLDESKLQEVLRRRVPTKYFWCDMTDMFLEDYPDEWIDRCFATMGLTPWHTHQVLTKRAERLRAYLDNEDVAARMDAFAWELIEQRVDPNDRRSDDIRATALSLDDGPLPNVWLGVSVEDQQRADERVPLLLQTPAAVRFVSYEPALGPVDFAQACRGFTRSGTDDGKPRPMRGLDWIICGGESGPGARPFHWEWATAVREQCRSAGIAFFMKQGGSNCFYGSDPWRMSDRKGGDIAEFPKEVRVREFPA